MSVDPRLTTASGHPAPIPDTSGRFETCTTADSPDDNQAHPALYQPVNHIRDPAPKPTVPATSQTAQSQQLTVRPKPKRGRQAHTNTLLISDAPKVSEFLLSRLKRMQQNAVKRLAKAWIRGICPKKQAKFPYQNHSKGVPGWWPPHNVCPFTEPDHIKKTGKSSFLLTLFSPVAD